MFNKKENEMSDGQIFRNGKMGLKGEIEGSSGGQTFERPSEDSTAPQQKKAPRSDTSSSSRGCRVSWGPFRMATAQETPQK